MDRTVRMFISLRHPTQKFQNMAKWVFFGPLFFNLIRLIRLCDKKNPTFLDRWEFFFIKLVMKNVIKPAKGSFNKHFPRLV